MSHLDVEGPGWSTLSFSMLALRHSCRYSFRLAVVVLNIPKSSSALFMDAMSYVSPAPVFMAYSQSINASEEVLVDTAGWQQVVGVPLTKGGVTRV